MFLHAKKSILTLEPLLTIKNVNLMNVKKVYVLFVKSYFKLTRWKQIT